MKTAFCAQSSTQISSERQRWRLHATRPVFAEKDTFEPASQTHASRVHSTFSVHSQALTTCYRMYLHVCSTGTPRNPVDGVSHSVIVKQDSSFRHRDSRGYVCHVHPVRDVRMERWWKNCVTLKIESPMPIIRPVFVCLASQKMLHSHARNACLAKSSPSLGMADAHYAPRTRAVSTRLTAATVFYLHMRPLVAVSASVTTLGSLTVTAKNAYYVQSTTTSPTSLNRAVAMDTPPRITEVVSNVLPIRPHGREQVLLV